MFDIRAAGLADTRELHDFFVRTLYAEEPLLRANSQNSQIPPWIEGLCAAVVPQGRSVVAVVRQSASDHRRAMQELALEQQPAEEQQPKGEQQLSFEHQPTVEKPSIEHQPPIEQQPVIVQQPTFDQQPSSEHQPPIAQQPSIEQQPPIAQQPSIEQQPPIAQQPSIEQQPPLAQQPSIEQQPPLAQQPSIEQQPPIAQQPSIEQQPAVDQQPPFAHQPPSEHQPPFEHQPPSEHQPTVERPATAEQQPAVRQQPTAEKQPTVEQQPIVEQLLKHTFKPLPNQLFCPPEDEHQAVEQFRIIGAALNDDPPQPFPFIYTNDIHDIKFQMMFEYMEKMSDVLRVAPSAVEIRLLAVDVTWRGKGVARALVEASMRATRDAGYKWVKIYCTSHFSNLLIMKMNWKRLYSLCYKDYASEIDPEIKVPPEPHTHCYLYICDLTKVDYL
ncbi:Hypothetical protein NTJ_11059 [Nesidiocoris tenuis]|uniref:N-acetyltransferase domain-containing protein n=1 Tax=Nesidiocoris tenuis TaxID=355587 RepID=A0ABN7B1E5_9HEMI|nr:Hypothetical protein NTJ_11059 [Nesidiocoris tenuis]